MTEMYFPVVPPDLAVHAQICVPLSELIPSDPQANALVVPLFSPQDFQRIVELLSYPPETSVSAGTYIAAPAGKPYVQSPVVAVRRRRGTYHEEQAMSDHQSDDTIPIGPEDPEDQAREAVEAMRAAGTLKPEVETAILAAGRGHARFLAKHGQPSEGEVFSADFFDGKSNG